jgi:hypothetical protein
MANMANTNNGYHVLHDNNSETGMFFQLDIFFLSPSLSLHLISPCIEKANHR